ncbi:hypothetical protein BG015_004180 [Linnemannia schmuckeri]|uniref:SPIN90/Ldb17 leucine-rich domain-containing protein n=1 Tax=Linnemannia schmuckeri TaxID=64567 RepID=A0A9P5S6T4_9FUNG|nr:hypothetical protein BG015_004180 [Linnemannia schmuckeri]
MDSATYHFDSPAQFFEELKDILERKDAYDSPAFQVNAYLSLMVHYQDKFLDESGQDLVYCCYNLFDSDVFRRNTEVITCCIIDRAIESSDDEDMWITYHVLLHAGNESPIIYRWMFRNEFFSKLKDQIQHREGTRMQLIAITLMYEMCRIQTLKESDLALADETFLNYLLDLVEHTRTDDAEQLNYGSIKLLLVFNEQYMLHTSSRPYDTKAGTTFAYSGNPLLTVLTDRLGRSATFGENLIFMLNRAEETALQMLILKVLYLLFTSPSLYEFFYTNDLHVLVDVVIRELWDLPEEEESLRHAYLRVMGPLLTNTQLKRATYKRAEIVRLLRELGGGDLDSTLRKQLQEQQLREQLLEQQRALDAKYTYRDRESSSSHFARWTSDRSGCSSPILSSEVEEKKRGVGRSKLSMVECSSDSLKVPGQDEAAETLRQHLEHQQELVSSPTDENPLQIEVPTVEYEANRQAYNNISRSSQRAASPTTQRLVERVLREWLDNEMKNGAGTTGHGLSVRGVTDGHSTEAADGRIVIPVAQ